VKESATPALQEEPVSQGAPVGQPAMGSSKRNIVKASSKTATHLKGYYPKEFLKRMGLA